MEIRILVQFETSRGATPEERDKIENDIARLINKYEDLVVGDINIELL